MVIFHILKVVKLRPVSPPPKVTYVRVWEMYDPALFRCEQRKIELLKEEVK